ncbi:MAG: S8 family serine peptidase [Phycisphaerales bacterium]
MKGDKSAWRRRLHPKLRMIRNGDMEVNQRRAEFTPCLHTPAAAPEPIASAAVPLQEAGVARFPRPKLKAVAERVYVNVFIDSRGAPPVPVLASEGTLSVARVPLTALQAIASRDDTVSFVQPAEALKAPCPRRLATSVEAPALRSREPGLAETARLHGHGEKVLIGIVDVQGFDFAHHEFLDGAGKSRFVRIWDQGGAGRRARPPAGSRFGYGNELKQDRLNKALADARKVKVSPHDLEPQSQMEPGSHGTHVASIAAGRSGVCPRSPIAAVLVALPREDFEDRHKSFYDSTRLLDAIEYLLDLAEQMHLPVSINVSLGTNGHAHDGSSPLDRWIDAWLARPGRAICVAAGNAGQEREESPGDMGYIFGRIHTSGRVGAKGLVHDIEWQVAGDGRIDVSENELEVWYEAQDRFAVSVRPPGGDWLPWVEPGEFLENFQLPSRTFLSTYNELYHPANGLNYIAIYLSPRLKDPVIGVQAGRWTVRLMGREVRDGRFHGWIERDDPVHVGGTSYYFPSFFSEKSNVDSSSVSSLACGERVISVANLDEAREVINISSSQGPTRTGGLKPDVAAPGTQVVAANGFGRPGDPYIAMTGTSMASPYVAGVVGLMLAAEPRLGSAQINGILKATARPLPGKSFDWVNDCGFGRVDPGACVREARAAFTRDDVERRFK